MVSTLTSCDVDHVLKCSSAVGSKVMRKYIAGGGLGTRLIERDRDTAIFDRVLDSDTDTPCDYGQNFVRL